uniref:WRKY19-like zinc finger domain-containing protein n=1 Tax=Peronospora matthiolae TaxID=2874970 RepID=A0AAV1UF25_9STRA
MTSNIESSPHFMIMYGCTSPFNDNGRARLPTINFMVNRDALPKSTSSVPMTTSTKHSKSTSSFVNKSCVNQREKYRDLTTASLQSAELQLNNIQSDTAVIQQLAEQPTRTIVLALHRLNKRVITAKLCGKTECNKRAKTGGFCIAHGGGLRCLDADCTKHALSHGLCIHHGGGKRCAVDGCFSASRKAGVCWRHGGKRLCKVEGCNKGPKTGGYCWSHGVKRKKELAAM